MNNFSGSVAREERRFTSGCAGLALKASGGVGVEPAPSDAADCALARLVACLSRPVRPVVPASAMRRLFGDLRR